MTESSNASHQRRYFSLPERKLRRMGPGSTPYVERHLEATLASLDVRPGSRLLELGAGMGRFSLLLADRGFDVVACDLSPDLLAALRRFDVAGRVRAIEADAALVDRAVDGSFDAVLGFFFLHHLTDLEPVFAAAARVLRPGGAVAFCEPNAWFFPYYLQIALTPGMSFVGERGLPRMRQAPLAAAAANAGLEVLPTHRFGLFPPGLANRALGRRVEAVFESALPAWAALRAFQVFAARRV